MVAAAGLCMLQWFELGKVLVPLTRHGKLDLVRRKEL